MRCKRGTLLDEMLAASQNCHFSAQKCCLGLQIQSGPLWSGSCWRQLQDCEKVQMSSGKVKEKKDKGNGGGRKERESWRVGMSDGERKCEKVSGRARERGDGGRKRKRVEAQTAPFLNTKEMRQKRKREMGQKVKVRNERTRKGTITREKPKSVERSERHWIGEKGKDTVSL